MNFYLVEIYSAAQRELERAKEDEREERERRLTVLWKAMGHGERALAEKTPYRLVTT